MLTNIEELAMKHYFITYPAHLPMQAVINDAISSEPKLWFVTNPLYSGMSLPSVMAAVCALIRELDSFVANGLRI